MMGKPLADGYFLVLWSIKGDLDYFAKQLHLRHYSRNEFCELCPANAEEGNVALNLTNFFQGC